MAAARRTALSITAWFGTGSTPGSPVHTGQMLLFGSAPHESARQLQKILLCVLSWMWVSSPMIAS